MMKAMLRDNGIKTQDMIVLEKMSFSVFDFDSLRRYRNSMKVTRLGHVWENLEDIEFLHKLGAVGIGEDGKLHPTSAGLLMFGFEYEILREYPQYFLDYQENSAPHTPQRWTDRFVSSSGEWSGNVFDFFYKAYNKLVQNPKIKIPFKMKDGLHRVEDTPVHKALREALSGGVSSPRNSVIMKMFSLLDIGERTGSGIQLIYQAWKEQNWDEPQYTEKFEPDRTILTLSVASNKNVLLNVPLNVSIKRSENVLEQLKISPEITAEELAKMFSVTLKTIQRDLIELKEAGKIKRVGSKKAGHWEVLPESDIIRTIRSKRRN
jgi:predicted HTH transcriptional regulator